MDFRNTDTLVDYTQALAFVGNSFLTPPTLTDPIGLQTEFWNIFPTFDSADVAQAVEACKAFARSAEEGGLDQARQQAAVDHAHLFIGPPRPAVAPWETMQVNKDADCAFGTPTFQMKDLLRDLGLELADVSRQYEDHIGIELLYLSELLRQAIEVEQVEDQQPEDKQPEDKQASLDATIEQAKAFIAEHPGRWIDGFSDAIQQETPNGYYAHLSQLAVALLRVLA